MDWLTRCIKNQKGVFLVFTAILIPIIFACAGLAMDLGNAFAHKSKLQNAADAAVLVYGRFDYGNSGQKPENAEVYMKANGAANRIDKVTERSLSGTSDANNVLLSLYASEDVPTTFMRMFGFDKVPVSVVATCKVIKKKESGRSVFDYAFIAGDNHDSYTCGNKPSFFVSNNGHRIIGPVHVNGAIGLSDNVDNRVQDGIRNVFVDPGQFSTSLPDDLHLWSGGRGCEKGQTPTGLHLHDIQLAPGKNITPPPNAAVYYIPQDREYYLYQYRFGYYNGTNWGDDVTASNSTYGVSQKNISLSQQNSETKAIYDYVEDLRLNYKPPQYDNPYGGARDVFIKTNGQYGDWYDGSTNAADGIWGFQYHTFIADGDINVYNDQIRWDKQPVVIISLHGNVNLALNKSVKALIYAPNGTIYYKNDPGTTFEGSMVGKYIDLNAQAYDADTVNLYKWNNFGFPNLDRDGSGSGESGGSSSGSDSTDTIDKVTLHADQDSNYGNESTLWGS